MEELGQQGTPEGWPPPPSTESSSAPWVSPTVDVLAWGPGQPGEPSVPMSRRRSRGGVVAGVLAVLLVVVAAAGYAAWAKLNGGGAQPDEVLPADTFAMVKLDLDPPAGQKVELYRLLQRFPHLTQVTGSDEDFKGWLLRRLSMVAADAPGVNFDRDIKPWLGDRVAVAAAPDGDSVEGLLVVQVTDEKAASDAMRRFSTLAAGTGAGDYVLHHGFLVVSSGRAGSAAAAVARADKESLAHNAQYTGDVASMHSDEVVTAWVDLARATDRVRRALAGQGLGGLGGGLGSNGTLGMPTQGRAVLGLHVTDGTVELQVRTLGGKPAPAEPPVGTPGDLAPGALGFVSISGAGDAVATGFGPLAASPMYSELLAEANAIGLDLPGDLRTLLGSRLTLSVGAEKGAAPVFLAASRTSDPAAAEAVLRKLLRSAGTDVPVAIRTTSRALYVGSSQAVVDAAGTGRLSSDELYRKAVVDSDRAQTVGFVDLSRVWDVAAAQGADIDPELRQVAAVGLSSTANGGDSTLTVRVVFR